MQFNTPRNIRFGRGSVEKLKNLVDGKTLIISGENVWKNVKELISLDSPVVYVKRRRWKEPSEDDVKFLAQEIISHSPSTIVAVGGGSVIDSAKLAWIFYEYPDIQWENIYSNISKLRRNTKFIAVETTSGTGTGVSAAAVVTDEKGKKRGVVSLELIPDVAIYDSNLVMGMPENVVIYSGMDALSHATEAYTTNVDNIIGDTLALKAVELIYFNIEDSVKGDENAREKVHHGNMLAGMAFANSRLHLPHAMAHALGGRYKIEHGKMVGMALPYVLRLGEKCCERFASLARIFGKDASQAIWELQDRLGFPHRLRIKEEDIPLLVEEIINDRLLKYYPCKVSKDEISKVLYAIREGDLDEI